MLMDNSNHPQPAVFGEALFDRFADGSAVLGGAPFNVAWHLAGFGLDPLFISRVGNDQYGQRIIASMSEWSLSRAGVQTDPVYPSGIVDVTIQDGHPSYSILANRAYDFIDPDLAALAAATADIRLVYHGTLALRNEVSRSALDRLLLDPQRSVFVDVNLRAPWWDVERIPTLLQRARWVKLNDQELVELGTKLAVGGASLEERAKAFQAQFDLDLLILTRGSAGALALGRDGQAEEVRPKSAITIVDTVGAGDAFASVVLVGLVQGWSLRDLLRRAQEFASAVCGIRGATIVDRGFYRQHLESWNKK